MMVYEFLVTHKIWRQLRYNFQVIQRHTYTIYLLFHLYIIPFIYYSIYLLLKICKKITKDHPDIYIPLARNPTSTIQQKANKIVSNLEKDNLISSKVVKPLRNYISVTSRFYGLSKIHKSSLSMRLVVSSIKSPNKSLAEFAKLILS